MIKVLVGRSRLIGLYYIEEECNIRKEKNWRKLAKLLTIIGQEHEDEEARICWLVS